MQMPIMPFMDVVAIPSDQLAGQTDSNSTGLVSFWGNF